METVEVLHMNKGVGETSYAMNSAVQNTIISAAKPATQKAIVQILCSSWPEKMGIADLGCSSGPNALRVISEIVDAVYATTRLLDRPAPELVVYLNDLFTNDFNNIFGSLPSFYKKQKQEKGSGFGSCFVSAVPGTFYGRLFPSKSLHFVHSSSSLHWLSQVPAGLEDRALNKGKIYISKSSPQCVLDAYSQQFQNDFSLFLASRSQEMVAGGRMVLSIMGRDSVDPTTDHSCYQWELLARSLMSMVSEGLLEEEMVDSFDAPYYAPCLEELKLEIEKEGSFTVDGHEAYEIDWDGGMELQSDSPHGTPLSSGERVARTVRAVVESMLESHFGCHVMDELFRRYAEIVEDHLSKTRTKYINLVISLVERC
ncbi:Jasmonate O-methyltransferase [Spatholobus suberectus]|nr:Jasmonate O-methyltransferase [Spatholobus suberectus]